MAKDLLFTLPPMSLLQAQPLPLLGTHGGEQQYIPNRRTVGKQHHQPVDADTLAGGWRHAVLQSAYVVGIVVHRLQVAGFLLRRLGAETLCLIFGVVELREAIGDLATSNKELETLGHERIAIA